MLHGLTSTRCIHATSWGGGVTILGAVQIYYLSGRGRLFALSFGGMKCGQVLPTGFQSSMFSDEKQGVSSSQSSSQLKRELTGVQTFYLTIHLHHCETGIISHDLRR